MGDTHGDPVPDVIVDFFGTKGSEAPAPVWNQTLVNCSRESIFVQREPASDTSAGVIRWARQGEQISIKTNRKHEPKVSPARFAIKINSSHSVTTQYATLVHELAHLYCGHIGTPNDLWWPNRINLGTSVEEFEAETVSWIVCQRLGIESPSARYLNGYLKSDGEIPQIAIELVLKVAGHIERMGREVLKLRKEKSSWNCQRKREPHERCVEVGRWRVPCGLRAARESGP